MSLPDDSNSQLADRLKLVREIEAKLERGDQPQPRIPRWKYACMALACGVLFVLWSVVVGTSTVPRGKRNREKAAGFLKQHFPDRELQPSAKESVTAPVAALFYVIRNGSPEDATKAIDFAAEQEFGYASPYVIERLESDDPQLRQAARNFLRKMAGTDYGPNAAGWKSWWSDPPRTFFGVFTVGRNSLQMAIPFAGGVIGLLALVVGLLSKRDALAVVGAALLVLGWFLFIGTLGLQLVGGYETCTFGGVKITYHQGHGVVEGLEDAKAGGFGLWLLLCLAYVGVPFVLMIVFAVLHQLWKGRKTGRAARF